ncbi:MAG: dGTPase [Betaproteobacteria bacterium]|nr:dGTPase [Betaproteobacteria bacterium]
MIDYKSLLSPTRLRQSTKTGRNILTESESDRGRVLFSPAFRRLQQKAQVFSMEPNAAVRSRLTHSLEVSQIGRYLADEIGLLLKERSAIGELERGALVNFVETACLMHDIGNPPFGHFGEAAIQEWFKEHGEACLLESLGLKVNDKETIEKHKAKLDLALADFREFDGNPQGLRIVTRLQWNKDEFGLNLTKTALASFLKYVRSPVEIASSINFTKKPGYFFCEKDIVENIWSEFGYVAHPQRFPVAYIMEAADDIAYCISDLEDSIEKGIIARDIAAAEILSRYSKKGFADSDPCHANIEKALNALANSAESDYTYTDFRTNLNTFIVKYVAARYVEKQGEIESGSLQSLLPEEEPPGFVLKVLKDFCREKVYTHESIQRVELAGYTAIFGLLQSVRPLLICSKKRFDAARAGEKEDGAKRRILLEPKLLKLFPGRYLKVYDHAVEHCGSHEDDGFFEWNARAHLVVDFISGMTDDFAMTTYRTLAGMRL